MDNPIVQKIVEFLGTPLPALIPHAKHVAHVDTRKPIVYDYHMPPQLQIQSLRYDPELSSRITKQFIKSLSERKTVKDRSMTMDGLDTLISGFKRNMPRVVPTTAVSEGCVKRVQIKIHDIAGPFATLAAFDVDNSEIHDLPSRCVFESKESAESDCKADLVIACEPQLEDTPERWGSLWSSISIAPRDLREDHYQDLFTEEHKNIRSGHPRALLGIYIVMWCLEKGHLKRFWPYNRCVGCKKFRKSHQATKEEEEREKRKREGEGEEEEEELDDAMPSWMPLDSPKTTAELVTTDVDKLEAEIRRIISRVETYDEKYGNEDKTAKRTYEDTEAGYSDAEAGHSDDDEVPAQFMPYQQILEDATNLASEELNLPSSITDGLPRWVVNAAYFLIQVRDVNRGFEFGNSTVVQVWGQMVRHNGTLAHFSCHNLAVIMARHRAAQSVVVSKVLEYTETPILRAAALTVYAYNDAGARFDEHTTQAWDFWTKDPFRKRTKAETKKSGNKKQKTSEPDEDDDDNQGPSGGGGGAGDAGGEAGGNGTGGPGNDGSSGGGGNGSSKSEKDKADRNKRAAERQKTKDNQAKQKANLDLDGVHLAFKTNKNHLWSIGFSHFKRLPTTTAAARVEATFGQDTSDERRRVSAGSSHSSRSTGSARSLFSERTSSVPTSPATTTSFTDGLSRDNSFSEKSPSHQGSSVTIRNAGILLCDVLGESAVGTVWSGKLIPEDGSDEDSSITIAVKMAVPRDNANSEADGDEREMIRQEASVYDFLATAGKQEFDITPRYYGVFEDDIGTVALVLDNAGEALESFGNLTSEQTQKLFVKAVEMHAAGVCHDDLVPRNVVQDSEGELRIIDFHVAKMRHRCHGKEKCKELLNLSDALGL
ncbi:hypothetical protein DFH06DRAFT_1119702 [Mycena polygramma]|nr:hypothetical protein DFH06DRAFT_1119702 [Mycena polygramma]